MVGLALQTKVPFSSTRSCTGSILTFAFGEDYWKWRIVVRSIFVFLLDEILCCIGLVAGNRQGRELTARCGSGGVGNGCLEHDVLFVTRHLWLSLL